MSNVSKAFDHGKAFIPFLTCGDPDLETTEAAVRAMAAAGADLIELGIPFSDPTYNTYRDISELPSHIFSEMRHFFSVYKNLEGKTTVVDEEQGPDEAKRIIQNCLDNYIEKFCR